MGVSLGCLTGAIAISAEKIATEHEMEKWSGTTMEEIHKMQDLERSRKREALAANILFGLSGAAILSASVLAYFDYRRAHRQMPPPANESAAMATGGVRWAVGPGSIQLDLSF
jgi:hypothetical protein